MYVPWQPKGKDGNIVYGQPEFVSHYKYYYQDGCKFTAFIDIDEFLFSPSNYDLAEFVDENYQKGITTMRLMHNKFLSRMCIPKRRVT